MFEQITSRNLYLRYEQEKQAWANRNPSATPEQYCEAMQRIAKRIGV